MKILNNRTERIWLLAKYEFKQRYYEHRFGIVWALIRPLIEMTVYFTFFGVILGTSIENFPIYIFSGMILWYLFTEGASKGILLLHYRRYLIENIQFRWTDLFISSLISGLMAFFFNFIAYCIMSAFLGARIYFLGLLIMPVILFNVSLFVISLSMILAVIRIFLKDIQHLWDMLVFTGFWGTPILFEASTYEKVIPGYRYINPMAGIMENMRQPLVYGKPPDWQLLILDNLIGLVLLMISWRLFTTFSKKTTEKI